MLATGGLEPRALTRGHKVRLSFPPMDHTKGLESLALDAIS